MPEEFVDFELLPDEEPEEEPQLPLPGPVTYTISLGRGIKLPGKNELETGTVVGELTVDFGLDPANVCRHMNKVFRIAVKRNAT